MSKIPREKKEGGYLFQLTEFDPAAPRDSHLLSKENFVDSSALVLDFDGGSVSHKEFADIFWRKASTRTKRSFIVTNSFSRSPENPNKFRVIFPFNGRAESIEQYEAITASIVQRLADHGHHRDASGLCPTATGNAVQSYYVPCTNAAHPESAFFETYGLTETARFLKHAIKPENYTRAVETKRWITNHDSQKSDNQRWAMEAAEALRAEIDGMRQDRRDPVFELVKLLMRAGISLDEISDDLTAWAGNDKRLKNHVQGAVKQWGKYSLETIATDGTIMLNEEIPPSSPPSIRTSTTPTSHTTKSEPSEPVQRQDDRQPDHDQRLPGVLLANGVRRQFGLSGRHRPSPA